MTGKRNPWQVRFWEKVALPNEDGCMLWTASLNLYGYGQLNIDNHNRLAHRLSYGLLVGSVPDGLVLDHLCRVRNCVAPDHLEPVSFQENLRRGRHRSLNITHCPKSHPYDEGNTYVGPAGRRNCRTCRREQAEERKRLRQSRSGR